MNGSAGMRKMTLIWLLAAATLATLLSGRSALAQEPAIISDSDVARLRAFIGDNNFDASPSPTAPQPELHPCLAISSRAFIPSVREIP